jgi:hypothetical protein
MNEPAAGYAALLAKLERSASQEPRSRSTLQQEVMAMYRDIHCLRQNPNSDKPLLERISTQLDKWCTQNGLLTPERTARLLLTAARRAATGESL